MILSGQTIRRLSAQEEPLLSPCVEADTFAGTSHGLGPAGYDLRLVLPPDTDNDDRVDYDQAGRRTMELWPGDFALVAAQERFNMPDDLVGIVHDKSTWARRGLAVQNTIIEPGWEGFLTLELTNHGKEPLELVEGQGIAQVVFHRLDEPAEKPYSGKYQNQPYGPVGPKS